MQIHHWQPYYLGYGLSELSFHPKGAPLLPHIQERPEQLVLHIPEVWQRVSGWDTKQSGRLEE